MTTQTEIQTQVSADEFFPGDELIPDAVMVYDQKRKITATADEIFPWLLQIGKGRGGWYLPERVERILPRKMRPARVIDERWQGLQEGDKVPDYGFSKHDHLIVKRVEPSRAIVLTARRLGCVFTWALLLHELHDDDDSSDPEPATVVHLRFRGCIETTGLRQKVLIKGGELVDRLSTMPLLAGLAERCEKPHSKRDISSSTLSRKGY